MRGLRLIEPGTVEVVDVEKPLPGPGEVLLRVAAASLCHTDVVLADDPTKLGLQHTPYPMTIGHEFAGWVEEVGVGVSAWSVGDAVAPYIIVGCGTCESCQRDEENTCPNGFNGLGVHRDGGAAEYVVVPATHLVSADGLDMATASALTDAGLTAHHAVARARDVLRPAGWSVVIGAGGLGHIAIQILIATAGSRVIAVDSDPAKLELASRHGATEVVLAGDDATETIRRLAPTGVDAVFDFVGAQATLELGVAVIRFGGAVHLTGTGNGAIEFGFGRSLGRDSRLMRTTGGTKRDLLDVFALARAGRIVVATEVFPLDAAPDVLARLERGGIQGRAVLIPEGVG